MTCKDEWRNLAESSRGRLTAALGGAVGNDRLAAKGRRDRRVANMKQAGEKVKDALRRR